jgi:hypothetical protein
VVRSPPGQFGSITNAHHISYGDGPTPWDETFEPVFGPADDKFPAIVEWLLTLDAPNKPAGADFEDRLHSQQVSETMLADLTTCIVSLIVRSPRFRNSIRGTVQHIRGEMGMIDPEIDDSLVAMNMRDCQQRFSKALSGWGKFAVLYTDCGEFIFGDGFLHNLTSNTNLLLPRRCLVPLTPTMTILYVRPLKCRREPRLRTMRLQPDEVRFMNRTVQIYSRDFVFFRNETPEIIADFAQREFKQYPDHRQVGLDALIAAMAPEA